MSIATEITRLQGVKTDIRNALISQGVDASTHNMANFSADILSIEGGGEKGVFITVTCDSAYIGKEIQLYLGTTKLDEKTCPSSLEVTLYGSANDVSLGSTLTIRNSLNSITASVPNVAVYGWYNTNLAMYALLYDNGSYINSFSASGSYSSYSVNKSYNSKQNLYLYSSGAGNNTGNLKTTTDLSKYNSIIFSITSYSVVTYGLIAVYAGTQVSYIKSWSGNASGSNITVTIDVSSITTSGNYEVGVRVGSGTQSSETAEIYCNKIIAL